MPFKDKIMTEFQALTLTISWL